MVRFCPSNLPSVRVEPFWGACSPLSSPVGIFGSVVSVKYATYMAANGECPGSFSPPGLCRERPVRWHGNIVGRNRRSLYLGMKDHKWWLRGPHRGGSELPGPRGLCLCSRGGVKSPEWSRGSGWAGPVGEGRPWTRVSVRWAHGRVCRWSSLRAF